MAQKHSVCLISLLPVSMSTYYCYILQRVKCVGAAGYRFSTKTIKPIVLMYINTLGKDFSN